MPSEAAAAASVKAVKHLMRLLMCTHFMIYTWWDTMNVLVRAGAEYGRDVYDFFLIAV